MNREQPNNDQTPHFEKLPQLSFELVSDFEKNGVHPLDNQRLYDHVAGLPSEERDNLLCKGMLSEKKKRLLRIIGREIGDKFKVCFFHPGIAVRIEAFIEFVKQQIQSDPKLTPDLARTRFIESLGTVTLYRGMVVKDDEVATMMKNGIRAPATKESSRAISAIQALFVPTGDEMDGSHTFPISFTHDVLAKTSDIWGIKLENSISCSTSVFEEVAGSVGWHLSKRKEEPGTSLTIFTLTVPVAHTYSEFQVRGEHIGPEKVAIDGKEYEGDGLELFIPFGVTSIWMSSFEKVPIPPNWKRVWRSGF